MPLNKDLQEYELGYLEGAGVLLIKDNGKIRIVGGGTGEGGGNIVVTGAQADWKQTDETESDFIKNKPNEWDAFVLVAEMGLITPIVDAKNKIYTNELGEILVL